MATTPTKSIVTASTGNNNAAKGKIWSDALRQAIVQRKDMDKLAAKLLDLVLGNMQALNMVNWSAWTTKVKLNFTI